MLRWVIGALVGLLALLQVQLWFGPGSVPALMELHDRVTDQREANERAQARNDALAAEVEDLKEGRDALEERARSQLGMIREDETFYQVIEDD